MVMARGAVLRPGKQVIARHPRGGLRDSGPPGQVPVPQQRRDEVPGHIDDGVADLARQMCPDPRRRPTAHVRPLRLVAVPGSTRRNTAVIHGDPSPRLRPSARVQGRPDPCENVGAAAALRRGAGLPHARISEIPTERIEKAVSGKSELE